MQIEGDVKSEKRYAIYYAPPKGSSLNTFGQTWLGRDARSGNTLAHLGAPLEDFAHYFSLWRAPTQPLA